MRSALLLQALEQKLDELARHIAPQVKHATVSPRFDRHLFHTRRTTLDACLQEAQRSLSALRHAVDARQIEQVAWLAEHLEAQIAALSREAASWSLREWDSPAPGIQKWQRKRLQHQQFEQRLMAMKREREVRLANVDTFAEQQQLHKEITALEGRLGRCREALENIERVLARLTR
ncbi:primosomal replication protein N'' [Kluyvera intermedia]|uniref:Primosomal replication protein N n=1 Tax=Kluyvera intermedia TaxID=61648 RepID=A0ABX3UBI4_KLUIN|nr:primosomal replication protein N'' [Kluyvera intermedia]ORJ48875.1 primosomal replication protein N'' [Kluyvera intermedia]